MKHRFLVVIPAYNEQASIERVVRVSQQYADVCVVNDASTDLTPQILKTINGVHCIHHQQNTHIAGAILDGMRYAHEAGYDFCITMDAGMSHDPATIPEFQKHTEADLVIGSRYKKLKVPIHRRLLSLCASIMINFALSRSGSNEKLRDVSSGFRMYSRRAVRVLLESELKSRSFDFHLEALACVAQPGMKVVEIPITYVYSNSSLRMAIVAEALRTWWRILIAGAPTVSVELKPGSDNTPA